MKCKISVDVYELIQFLNLGCTIYASCCHTPSKKEVVKNPESEKGEGAPDDLLSKNGLSPETIEKPAQINEIPEGNHGIW